MMQLEQLARRIALPLQRFAVPGVEPGQRTNTRLKGLNQRVYRRQIAAIAGAKPGLTIDGVKRRWPGVAFNPGDQSSAFGGLGELLDRVQIKSRLANRNDRRIAPKPPAHLLAKACKLAIGVRAFRHVM